MQTCAHPIQDEAHHTGVLLRAAEARTRLLDGDGHAVPVLCMDLEMDNLYRTHVHVEQPFPVGHFTQAQAAAHRYKRGMRVTVQAPLVGVSLTFANVTHIHVIPDQPQEQPAP